MDAERREISVADLRQGWGQVADDRFDYNSERWRRMSKAIRRRDQYQCVWCRRYGRIRQARVVHHIKEPDAYPELAFDPSNLVSLCMACHNKAHPEKAAAIRKGKIYYEIDR